MDEKLLVASGKYFSGIFDDDLNASTREMYDKEFTKISDEFWLKYNLRVIIPNWGWFGTIFQKFETGGLSQQIDESILDKAVEVQKELLKKYDIEDEKLYISFESMGTFTGSYGDAMNKYYLPVGYSYVSKNPIELNYDTLTLDIEKTEDEMDLKFVYNFEDLWGDDNRLAEVFSNEILRIGYVDSFEIYIGKNEIVIVNWILDERSIDEFKQILHTFQEIMKSLMRSANIQEDISSCKMFSWPHELISPEW